MIANDAATLPASLHGVHVPSGADIEVRLAACHRWPWTSLTAVVLYDDDIPLHGRRLRRRRLPHADRGPAAAAGAWRRAIVLRSGTPLEATD